MVLRYEFTSHYMSRIHSPLFSKKVKRTTFPSLKQDTSLRFVTLSVLVTISLFLGLGSSWHYWRTRTRWIIETKHSYNLPAQCSYFHGYQWRVWVSYQGKKLGCSQSLWQNRQITISHLNNETIMASTISQEDRGSHIMAVKNVECISARYVIGCDGNKDGSHSICADGHHYS